MYLQKKRKYSLNQIRKYIKENKINIIRIEYIWCNTCEICGTEIQWYDEEYSWYIEEENGINERIFNNYYSEFKKDYFEYELNEEQFTLILNNEETKELILYKYRYDYTEKERCKVCEKII